MNRPEARTRAAAAKRLPSSGWFSAGRSWSGIRSIVDRHLRACSAARKVNSAASEREHLGALLAALEEPARAAAFEPDDATLVAVARHHRLTPLLSFACGARLPPALAATFRR